MFLKLKTILVLRRLSGSDLNSRSFMGENAPWAARQARSFPSWFSRWDRTGRCRS